MKKKAANNKRTLWNLIFNPDPWKIESGVTAIFLVVLVVGLSGAEAAYVQVKTTNRVLSPELLTDISFLLLFSLDILVPLTVALLSRPAFIIYLMAQCFLSTILLHYTIFFYNTLTLSTIYHSLQGAASLGIDIFGFARWEIIFSLGALLAVKLFLVQVSMVRRVHMPKVWHLRGITAVTCMAVISWVVVTIYGKTGLSLTWVDVTGHRPAAERRLEEGARESVRAIGYLATWLGEFFSGNYKDTTLIYAEARCQDPDGGACSDEADSQAWMNIPVPPLTHTVVIIQAESLDFAVLDMKVNGRTVTPFIDHLARSSVVLKVFAPHKVGSCNSDYEILNGRIAEQNVLYYTYIKNYPDSVIHLLNEKGYEPGVFHGLSGSLFNLREAYAAQGFKGFYFKEEMLADGYKVGPYIMEHILDEDVFDSAARHLESAPGRAAQFIVTMTSHVPFIPAWPEYKSAGGSFARYVSSLSYLDRCLGDFYQKLPEGTLLIIWGDHGSDVSYPRGFAPGDRHVPLLVHVKGREAWLNSLKNKNVSGRSSGEPELTASSRIYTLCEFHFYLRRIFQQVRP